MSRKDFEFITCDLCHRMYNITVYQRHRNQSRLPFQSIKQRSIQIGDHVYPIQKTTETKKPPPLPPPPSIHQRRRMLERRTKYKPPPILPKPKRDPCPERPIRKANTWTRSSHHGTISPIQLPTFDDDEFERYSPSLLSTPPSPSNENLLPIIRPSTYQKNKRIDPSQRQTTVHLPPIKSHPKPWR